LSGNPGFSLLRYGRNDGFSLFSCLVSAVCHHGGAGTTATALRAGKPPIILPFFGDQFFWGNVIEKSGSGPAPIPGKEVTVQQLVEAFKFAHKPEVRAAARRIREDLSYENGCAAAVPAFHANLPISRMRSDLESTFAACYCLDDFHLKLSRPVAQVLLSASLVKESQFRYHTTLDWQLVHDMSSS
jgi:sterol 3beta-glucosyltransferase